MMRASLPNALRFRPLYLKVQPRFCSPSTSTLASSWFSSPPSSFSSSALSKASAPRASLALTTRPEHASLLSPPPSSAPSPSSSVLSGFLGMKIATYANARTTLEARRGVGCDGFPSRCERSLGSLHYHQPLQDLLR